MNEPDKAEELCGAVFARASRFGQWGDLPCERLEYPMCETDKVSYTDS